MEDLNDESHVRRLDGRLQSLKERLMKDEKELDRLSLKVLQFEKNFNEFRKSILNREAFKK